MNNQKQIVTATLMYAQDHEEMLPDAATFWGALSLDKGVLKCPTKSRLANGYVLNKNIAGLALGNDKCNPPDTIVAIGDGVHTATTAEPYENVAYNGTEFDKTRHTRPTAAFIGAFLDGHVDFTPTAPTIVDDTGMAMNTATIDALDTSTSGNWWTAPSTFVYGTRGYVLPYWNSADVISLGGSYVASVTPTGNATYTWGAANQTDTRAPINPANGQRAASCWYQNAPGFSFTVALSNAADTAVHTMRLYVVDWDQGGARKESVTVDIGGTTVATLTDTALGAYNNGTWIPIRFRGNNVKVTLNPSSSNGVISAICFD